MYEWRKLTPEERKEVLDARIDRRRPWHRPPHSYLPGTFILSAACFEHLPHIAYSAERLDDFSERLVATAETNSRFVLAWCVLPNHYHLVVVVEDLQPILKALGLLHGRTSYEWNLEENILGRQIWHSISDRKMRSERHLWATINYVHNNPVKHGYVDRWQDWPWGSAIDFLKQVSPEEAKRIWLEHPVAQYGDGWDD
jgi:putative transposase